MKMKIRFAPKNEGVSAPAYQTADAAGFDLPADITKPLTIKPGRHALIPTGIYAAVPPCFELQVRPRSGLALKHMISVTNSPGTVDADYRGEIAVMLINFGASEYTVYRNDRIAQAVISPVAQPEFEFVDTLDETDRGAGGYGSTGR
jgi:dUTP pyrophosphatase